MSKTINLEVVSIDREEGYVSLETEDGQKLEVQVELLPDNLREGRFLRFVISHTDYSIDEKYEYADDNHKGVPDIPNGRRLAW